jgi:hypothetical protein
MIKSGKWIRPGSTANNYAEAFSLFTSGKNQRIKMGINGSTRPTANQVLKFLPGQRTKKTQKIFIGKSLNGEEKLFVI